MGCTPLVVVDPDAPNTPSFAAADGTDLVTGPADQAITISVGAITCCVDGVGITTVQYNNQFKHNKTVTFHATVI